MIGWPQTFGEGRSRKARRSYRPAFEALEERAVPSTSTLIGLGDTWKYLDDGSDQGAVWRGSTFNDAAWASGAAALGYGDGEATTVSFGPSANAKFITTYFRHTFDIGSANFSSLNLRLQRDDGAVLYLNGTEIFRSNMPSGAISHTTRASTGVSGLAESAFFAASVNPSLLVPGANVLAVEIHQEGPSSSDIRFDLELTGDDSGGGATEDPPPATSVTRSFQDGAFPSSTYAGTRDTHIRSDSPTANVGTATSLLIDGSPDEATLLKWDLGSIPSGSTVQAVTLGLNVTDTSSHAYSIYEMKRDWAEGQATWNIFAGGTGNGWQTAGAQGNLDRGSTVLGTLTLSSNGFKTLAFNASGLALVQSWVDTPSSNHGIVIQNYSATDGADISARESGTAASRPKFTVTYTSGSGEPAPNRAPVATNDSLAVAKGGSASVNVLANDNDPDGDSYAVTGFTQPAHGSLTRSGGVFTYTPQSSYTGADSFTYTIQDGGGLTATATVSITVSAPSSSTPITFRVMGDTPYQSSDFAPLRRDLADVSSADRFFVHVGDIKSGSSACTSSYYKQVANTLEAAPIPLFIVPGDNEWNDCSSPKTAWGYWSDNFMRFEDNWNHSFNVAHQSSRPENFAFVHSGTLFIGLNLPGGSVSSVSEWKSVVQADASWITQNFNQYGSQVKTVVLFAQAYPDEARKPAGDALVAAAKAFKKPVLFMQGDLHSWDLDHPWSAAPNITRVVVSSGSPSVRVTVTGDANKPYVFDRSP